MMQLLRLDIMTITIAVIVSNVDNYDESYKGNFHSELYFSATYIPVLQPVLVLSDKKIVLAQ